MLSLLFAGITHRVLSMSPKSQGLVQRNLSKIISLLSLRSSLCNVGCEVQA